MADDLNGGRRIFLAHAAALPALYAVGAVAAISPSDEGRAVDLIAAFRSTSKLGAKGEVQGEGPASDYVGLLLQMDGTTIDDVLVYREENSVFVCFNAGLGGGVVRRRFETGDG